MWMLQKWLWIVEEVNYNIRCWYNILRVKTFGINLERFETCIGLQYNTYIHPTGQNSITGDSNKTLKSGTKPLTECWWNGVIAASISIEAVSNMVCTFVLYVVPTCNWEYFYFHLSQFLNSIILICLFCRIWAHIYLGTKSNAGNSYRYILFAGGVR